jgi:DNA-binding beta-propeller fold protein YncE
MTKLSTVKALTLSAAMALLVDCSGSPAISPKPSSPQAGYPDSLHHETIAHGNPSNLSSRLHTDNQFESFNACPATGRIVYVSNYENSAIEIFYGGFHGQHSCGRISHDGLSYPQGIFVKDSTHDLYVANRGNFNILVFHRGATRPYNTLIDPTGQIPVDITVAEDGTVIAANRYSDSISTWRDGPGGGMFVGNFPISPGNQALWVAVGKGGTVYFSDFVSNRHRIGRLWRGKCPLGVCGRFYVTSVRTVFPGGLRPADGGDIAQIDEAADTLTTYHKLPNGASCHLGARETPAGFDFDRKQHHVFYADGKNYIAVEVSYPDCTPIGYVSFDLFTGPYGVAVDQ